MRRYLFVKPAQFAACAVSGAVSALLGMCMGFVDGAFVRNRYIRRVKSGLRQDLFEKIMDQSVPAFNS